MTDIISKLINNAYTPQPLPDYFGHAVLHAEDMAINRRILKHMLQPARLEVDSACNGLEAAGMFKAHPMRYSLIFMDMEMPLMDGCAATRQIRASGLPRCKEIPIVAITSNESLQDIDRCLDAGMNAYLHKPYDPEKIAEVLKVYLR